MSVKGKKLLVLAGQQVHCRVVQTANEMGVYTIVTDYLADSPAKKIANESLMYSIFDVDEIVAYCREHHVDGVINICNDPSQRVQQQICEKLGLPCYGNERQVFSLTDKNAFKQMCISNGVNAIPEYTIEEIKAGKAEFPIFVKPVDSRGSRGQTICRTPEEIDAAAAFAASESSNGKVIFEKYMGGKDDFSLTYLVINGVPCLFRTADRHLGLEEEGLNHETNASISPSAYSALYKEKIEPFVHAMIKKLGIVNGPVLMQGFVDNGSIYFYDPGIRLPGNAYEKLYDLATGTNLMQILIEYVLGEDIGKYTEAVKDSYTINKKRLIQIMYNLYPGKIARVEGVEEVRAHESVVAVVEHHHVGDEIKQTGDFRQRGFEIDILCDDLPEKTVEAVKFVNRTLKVYDENGRNMYASPLDPERFEKFYYKN